MEPYLEEPTYPPRTIILGLSVLALNSWLCLSAPDYNPNHAAFFTVVGATLAFLLIECAKSRTIQRANWMGMLAFWFFFGPAGLIMILAETFNLWAAILSYVCIMVFGPLYAGRWLGQGLFRLFNGNRR